MGYPGASELLPVGWLATAPSSCSCHCLGPSCELASYRHGGGSLHDGASAGAVSWAKMSKPWHFLVRVWLPPNACPKTGERLQTPCFFVSAPVNTSDFFLPLCPLSMEHLYGSTKSQTIPRLPFLVALPWSVPHFPMAWAHTFESSEQSKDWAGTFGAK